MQSKSPPTTTTPKTTTPKATTTPVPTTTVTTTTTTTEPPYPQPELEQTDNGFRYYFILINNPLSLSLINKIQEGGGYFFISDVFFRIGWLKLRFKMSRLVMIGPTGLEPFTRSKNKKRPLLF